MIHKYALFWLPRWKFKTLPRDPQKAKNIEDSPGYLASEKKDGTLVFGEIGKDRKMHLIARNKSVSGDYINRTDYAPHISQKKYSKALVGTKIIGELYHPKGFAHTSRILNSTPDNAQNLQRDIGQLYYMPFDIYSYGNKRLTGMPYIDRLHTIRKFVRETDNPYIKNPNYRVNNKKDFADKIKAQGKEGVVYVQKDAPLFGGNWYKDKKRVDFDLKIVGFTEGTGKYAGKGIGAFIVEDRSGRYRTKVGIGLSDDVRRDAYQHPEKYLNRIAKIEALELTNHSLRHPKYLGLEDKTTPDKI